MAKSTGIILAVGGVTLFNQVILNQKDIDWRIPVATGMTAVIFSLGEKVNSTFTVGIAWVALATVLLTRVNPKEPSPTENLLKYWNQGQRG